jgi:pimeloyl-ACP methyl ester carboxylesterase
VAVFLLDLICEPALAAQTDPPQVTRFLSPTGQVLPDDYQPKPQFITYFVIHGFQASGQDEPSRRLAWAITWRFPDANVVIVDWRISSPSQNRKPENLLGMALDLAAQYQRSVQAAKEVGKDIAGWMTKKGLSPNQTVICGHSLGAQIAAFSSQECIQAEQLGQRVRAILAADPAGPCFSGEFPENRLDQADADEVIVIHATMCLGDSHVIGTVDVYLQWPESSPPDYLQQHSQARELLTESFLRPRMASSEGIPFGINSLGSDVMGVFSLQPNDVLRQARPHASSVAAK